MSITENDFYVKQDCQLRLRNPLDTHRAPCYNSAARDAHNAAIIAEENRIVDMTRSQMDPNPAPDLAHAEATAVSRSGRLPSLPPARTLLGAFSDTCRFDAALATMTPVAVVSSVTWWQTGRVDWAALLFGAAAAFGTGLGAHLLTEYHARLRAAAPHVQSALQAAGQTPAGARQPDLLLGEIKSLAYIALLISLLCNLWLGLLVGWPMVLFGGVALALAWGYSSWPLRYANWGFGLGESGLFVALGLLPAIASYYAQVGILGPLALWSGVPFALLGSLMQMTYTLQHYRRDWLIRRRTLPVVLGVGYAIDFSTVLLISAFAFIIFAAVVTELPLRTLIAILGLPIATSAYAQIDREHLPPQQSTRLYTAAIHATLATALLYCLALITSRLW